METTPRPLRKFSRLLLTAGSAQGLAAGMTRLRDRRLRERMAERARARASEFDASVTTERMLALYARLVAVRARS